jgi:hypothetical protein
MQDCTLRTRHLVDWMRNNVGVATYGNRKVQYGVGGIGGADQFGVIRRVGRVIVAEFKVWPNRPTEAQSRFLRRIERDGGIGILVYRIEDLWAALDMALYGRVMPRGTVALLRSA